MQCRVEPWRLYAHVSFTFVGNRPTSRQASLTSAIGHGIRRSQRLPSSPSGSSLLSRGDVRSRIRIEKFKRDGETPTFEKQSAYGIHGRGKGTTDPSLDRHRPSRSLKVSEQAGGEDRLPRSQDHRVSQDRKFSNRPFTGKDQRSNRAVSGSRSTSNARGGAGRSYAPSGRARSDYTRRDSNDRSSADLAEKSMYRKPDGEEAQSLGQRSNAYENRGHTGELRRKSKARKKEDSAVRAYDRNDPEANPDFVKSAPRHSKAPLSVPFTTPASDFIYGTSAVTAALRAGRREFYKLYIYDGENRESAQRDASVVKLGLAAGVHVSKVGEEWMSLLDKMSRGRPHNVSASESRVWEAYCADEISLQGYVLEASPLPKLPIIAFEAIDRPSGHFKVIIAPQSREEIQINGTENILASLGGIRRYPFVLMLDRIVSAQRLIFSAGNKTS